MEIGVFGKYVDPKKVRLSPASFVRTGLDQKIIRTLGEYSQNLAAAPNEIAIANVIALVISEVQQKPAPEAYMGYVLYDADSNLYEYGKVILSKKARNKHEELIQKLAIKKDGYIETYLVNETAENVWFDQYRIMSTGPLIVQETHYDPWGVDLSGLGYQYGGIKTNPYLYNGKELTSGLGVIMYDYGARFYIPAIGRWFVHDPLAEKARRYSPYNYALNNPMRFMDPDGMEAYSVMGTTVLTAEREPEDPLTKSVLNDENVTPLGGDDCVNCMSLPEFTVSAKREQPNTSNNNNFLLITFSKRDPYSGFWGYLDYFLNGGISNGVQYDIKGNPLGLAPITGTPPDLIGGPLMRGDKVIKLGKYAFNSRFFHRVFKPKILSKAGDYSKIVGNNPDISLEGVSIVLKGATNGPFKGKSFKTTLTIFDLIF
ncbi:RHS repeat-associated core domain-containing protein [Algoriphagus halophilus]|uniref:RHS repeat domain-containing protein n=1 Tax=Algoriphagus halophilus TaxID=226505 RepID=UPI00358F0173